MAHNKSHKYMNKMEKKEKQPNPDKMFRKQVKEEMDRKGIKELKRGGPVIGF